MPVLVRNSRVHIHMIFPSRHIKISKKRYISPFKKNSYLKQNKNRDRRASLTAEASIVLPLFFYTFYSLWQCFLLLLTQLSVGYGVAEVTLTSASLGYLERRVEEAEDLAWLYEPLIWNAFAGENYLEELFVSFEEEEDGKIKGTVSYVFSCQVPLIRDIQIPVSQSFCFMPYIGEYAKDRFSSEKEEDIVYVTATGSVFHESKSCGYLSVEVIAVSKDAIREKRNSYGSKYNECSKCKGEDGELFYISAGGTKYHRTVECSSLKRVVEEKKREEVSLPACSRCGEQREE